MQILSLGFQSGTRGWQEEECNKTRRTTATCPRMQTRVSTGAPEPTRPNGRHLSLRARITCTVVCIERAFPLAFLTCRRLCRDNQWRCSAHFASTPCKGRADSKNGAGRDNWPNVPKAPSFMGVTCDPECVEWAKAFDDCVCTNKVRLIPNYKHNFVSRN